MPTTPLIVPTVIDEAPMGRLQILALMLCAAACLMDGFDMQMIGFVAPAIMRDWHLGKTALAPVFAAGLAGMLAGSLLLTIAADRFGRRPTLIAATLFFGLSMLLTPLATTPAELACARLLVGLGLGSILPNAVALTREYTARRIRATVVMIVGACFPIGGIVAGLVCSAVLPRWGWPAVFRIGGVVPLLLFMAMLVWLPESIQYLVLRRRLAEAHAWLRRLVPAHTIPPQAPLRVDETPLRRAPLVELFLQGRSKMTGLIWGLNILNLLTLYFLASWIPSVVRSSGHPLSDAILAGTMLQLGGSVGVVLLGTVIDKIGFRRVMFPCLLVGACAIFSVGGAMRMPVAPLLATIALAGFCVIGTQGALNLLAAYYYPTALRATGIGWALGVGRLSSIAGPVLMALFVTVGLHTSAIFLVVALPSVLSAALVLCMSPRHAGGQTHAAEMQEVAAN